jgi:hypothetical protein
VKSPGEIACDESGYEGEKLIGGVTDVFAHAAVRLDEESAARCIKELRERIRSPATEYKANHVLRSKHRPVLLWLLGPSGPLLGQAQVQLVDKRFFLVSRVVELLAPGSDADGVYAAGRSGPGAEWEGFLKAANTLLRVKEAVAPVEAFEEALAKVQFDGALKDAGEVRATLLEDPRGLPPLDPLLPAILRAVEFWGGPVAISHDRQTTLSPERIGQLKHLTADLADLELVDSFSHPRVQVADFLAGVARKIASDQLKGTDDVELTTLLRPYVDPLSIWSDPSSWRRLTA